MNPPIPHHYDPENARFLARLSLAAYEEDAGSDWLAARGFHVTAADASQTDTRALIASDGVDCVAAFRGTQDLRNWLTDLDCAFANLRVDGSILKVHAGFKRAFLSVWETFNLDLQKIGRAQRFWLTGHSLGGALAMLCARCSSGPLAGVYTFGQPRAGGGAFAFGYDALLRDRTFRIVHAADIVPRVPWLPGGYRHAGHEVFFPSPLVGRALRCAPPRPRAGHEAFFPSSLVGRALRCAPPRPRAGYEASPPPLPEGQGEAFRLDPPWWRKLPSDILRLARQARYGKIALLDDHHAAAYVTLVSTTPPPVPAFNFKL